ncbi:molybdate transport repressor ModE-like protein [Salana multivorans]|uniref:Molybdate transport repressor ModE-like protein n=1 Tax=Salana multivorans TaxID=120377 RepID=A0A3N2D0I4_9MICO|nr:LysR family transcriptional regulator [Salana multivorans]ROR93279.1 molybdate transport repressor ModE-like protein [Salana multivorans]
MSTGIDLSALRLLQAIRDQGTLTAAAESLGVSQPAVSQNIQRLERRLGTPLLVRAGRSVRLTEAGEVLARHGESVSAALRAAEAEIVALTGLQSGLVRLAAFPSSSSALVPRALAILRERHPGVAVRLEEVEPPESLAMVRTGEVDVALAFAYEGTDLGRGEDDLTGLCVQNLLEDPVLLALPRDHELAGRKDLSLVDARDERWIAGCPRCRGHLMSSARASGFTPDITFATDDPSAVLGLVGEGLGVGLLPGMVRPIARAHDGVVLREVAGVSPRSVHAVTSPDLLGVPAVGALLDAVRDAVAELA